MFMFGKKEKKKVEVNLNLDEVLVYLELELEDANDLYERTKINMQVAFSNKEKLLQEKTFKLSYYKKKRLENLIKYIKGNDYDQEVIDGLINSESIAIDRLGLSYQELLRWYQSELKESNVNQR